MKLFMKFVATFDMASTLVIDMILLYNIYHIKLLVPLVMEEIF